MVRIQIYMAQCGGPILSKYMTQLNNIIKKLKFISTTTHEDGVAHWCCARIRSREKYAVASYIKTRY